MPWFTCWEFGTHITLLTVTFAERRNEVQFYETHVEQLRLQLNLVFFFFVGLLLLLDLLWSFDFLEFHLHYMFELLISVADLNVTDCSVLLLWLPYLFSNTNIVLLRLLRLWLFLAFVAPFFEIRSDACIYKSKVKWAHIALWGHRCGMLKLIISNLSMSFWFSIFVFIWWFLRVHNDRQAVYRYAGDNLSSLLALLRISLPSTAGLGFLCEQENLGLNYLYILNYSEW